MMRSPSGTAPAVQPLSCPDGASELGSEQDVALLVSAGENQPDPLGSVTTFLRRASTSVELRDPVVMSCLVYFTTMEAARGAREEAERSGWHVTLFAVPDAYVARLTRERLLTDGLLDVEREEVLRLSAAHDGLWRHVLLEQLSSRSIWDICADEIKRGAEDPHGGLARSTADSRVLRAGQERRDARL